jgi:hypothetical protein
MPTPSASSIRTKLPLIGIGLLFVVSLAGNAYLGRQVYMLSQDPQRMAQQEMLTIVGEVGKLMVLPEGETPTIATVTDPEKLAGQAFFANASSGDKVLLYTNAKKAILYSPSQNKILEVAPINLGDTTVSGEATDTTTITDGSDNGTGEVSGE